MATFDVDDVAVLSVIFAVTATGVETDPSTVALVVTTPSLTTTTYTYAGGQVTKTATGRYAYQLAITESGTYEYRWVGTGAAAGAEQGSVTVRARNTRA